VSEREDGGENAAEDEGAWHDRDEPSEELREAADVLDQAYADIHRERLREMMRGVAELERMSDEAPELVAESRRVAARELLATTKYETGWVAGPCIRAAAAGEAGIRALLAEAERTIENPAVVAAERAARLEDGRDSLSPITASLSTPDEQAAVVERQAGFMRTWAMEYLKLFD
jgi:uncharacterized protein YjiS (DUF1127 family)